MERLREEVAALRIDKGKLDIVLAKRCKNLHELRFILSASTLSRIRKGNSVETKTVGKLAEALGVDPAELISTEGV